MDEIKKIYASSYRFPIDSKIWTEKENGANFGSDNVVMLMIYHAPEARAKNVVNIVVCIWLFAKPMSASFLFVF